MEKKKLVSRAEIKQFIKENNLKSVEDIHNVLKDLFA
ncbi:MAG: (2Fe-2S)-binding protein, partial [Syntrophomonadaceae bacterium]|nr:(2Fe-2S)-binding protein [Syntrophomonadaceae bacterium]